MAVFGLGLLFYGMEIMSNTFSFLRAYPPFLTFLTHLSSPPLAVVVSTLFTVIIQSSGATIALLLSLASKGLLPPSAAIPLVLGANIGTCFTALFAAVGKPIAALRVAAALVVARVLGAAVCLLATYPFAKVIAFFAATDPLPTDAAELSRFVAAAHTVFNIFVAAAVLPFSEVYANAIAWVIRDGAQRVPKEEVRMHDV
jgi:phosphate:Na+ symporter